MKICSRQGLFELMNVNHSARSGGILWTSFRFFNKMVCCVFSLESPHRGDSNGYTQYTFFHYKKENHPKLSQICSYGICSKGLKNQFETAVVNEPSVFEPLIVYCILVCLHFTKHCLRYASTYLSN